MTNPENPTHKNELPQRSSADYFIDYCISTAPTRRLARTLRELYGQHGAAFAAYLSLEDVNTASATLINDYENAYVGTYLDEETFVESELAPLGWFDAIDETIQQQGIPEGVVTWNHDVFLDRMRDVYDIVDLDGYLHVFSK